MYITGLSLISWEEGDEVLEACRWKNIKSYHEPSIFSLKGPKDNEMSLIRN
jgi:hypothetical protein